MKIKDEIWLPVKGHDGLYEVSDMGRVRSLSYRRTGKAKLLTPRNSVNGYLLVHLYKDGKERNFYIHRLVYEAFRGAIPKGLTVDHINNVKTDNRLENLQLLTNADNVRKARNKQLDLIEANWPYREYTFQNSLIASQFFNYKAKNQVGVHISKARKLGRNWVNLNGTKYLFSQEA